MMRKSIRLVLLGIVLMTPLAYADTDADGESSTWASRAQAGYAKTGGNTDTTTANALFHIAHVVDQWKFLFGAEGLYGSTKGETTAQAWDLHFQTNYNFTDRLYGYGGLRYDENKFSGFAYQELVTTGVGYQFFNSDDTKLAAQAGVGARRLRPEILTEDAVGAIVSTEELNANTDAVFDSAVNLEHSFNSFTKIVANVAVEAGKDNTMTTAGLSLQVKMTDLLSLAAAYQLIRNSKPPMGAGPTNSLTSLNLVYEFKNKKLAPE